MALSRLWVAMLTRIGNTTGTDSPISLSVNTNGVDRLNHTFPDTDQEDQEEAQANLYEVNVENRGIEPTSLTDSSIRLHILGNDRWFPQHFFVWGETSATPLRPAIVLPLAIEMGISAILGTDNSGARASLPLRLVRKGGGAMQINRLLLLTRTVLEFPDRPIAADPIDPHGSEGTIEIQVVSGGQLVTLFEIRDTLQLDLDAGQANFYTVPVMIPFTKNSLNNQSITLRLRGMDSWGPASFFLFGLDDATGRPESIVPLVYLPEWPFGLMEPDPTNATASVTLPIVLDSQVEFDLGDTGVFFKTIESKQDVTNDLLRQLLAKMK